MNPQIVNLGLAFGIIQLANKFQLDKEENVMYLRIAYLATQLICGGILLFALQKVQKANGPFDKEVETIRTTVRDHDRKKLREQFVSQLVGVSIIALMHFKWGYVRPLLLQSVLGLRAITQTPIFKIYILGQPATGALNRPWKQASPFGQTVADVPTAKDLKAKEKKEAKKKLKRLD
ncbi:hypothetical protein HK104_005427 [Borealophlyctis nickersoniae]|nr:hypothetical protein HK104_005427 [Borealophlyctis nickersoniae]